MDKQTYLKAFYTSQIAQLIERVNDLALLDLIYKLLTQEDKTK